ncbi:hypothetical protein R1Z17_002830, partial [Clostridium perfringens]|nr:hypothetical protein [Clostridium perfringens]
MSLRNQKNILILWFLVFIMTIFLNLKINSILFVLTILIPILINDINNLIEVVIIILIGTPMLNGKIGAIFTRNGINILDILILVLFLKVIFVKFFRGEKLDFKLNLLDYLLGIFFILNFIAFIRGINFYGKFSIEFKNIIFMYLLYITLKIYNFKVGIKRICDLIFYSVGIYSLCIFLTVIWGFTNKYALIDYEGRIAINITLLIITIPYYIY